MDGFITMIIISAFCFIVGIFSFKSGIRKKKVCTELAVAKIVDVHVSYGDGHERNTYSPIYAFEINGQEYKGTIGQVSKKRKIEEIWLNFEIKNVCMPNITVFNGVGDFLNGGPNGDNGLSGKKLVVDFYGTNVPIGGGAIYGKDPHKVDVVGAKRCRDLALLLCKELNYKEVFTRLVFSPGQEEPHSIEAYGIDEFGTRYKIPQENIPPRDWFSICCASKEIINSDFKVISNKIC